MNPWLFLCVQMTGLNRVMSEIRFAREHSIVLDYAY